MSELQFSGTLVKEVLNVLARHDERVETEDSVSTQYLAGIIGFLIGREARLSREEKETILQELTLFAGRVVDDIESQYQKEEPQQQSAEAEGVWRPSMN